LFFPVFRPLSLIYDELKGLINAYMVELVAVDNGLSGFETTDIGQS
jgi:hypothetical protein